MKQAPEARDSGNAALEYSALVGVIATLSIVLAVVAARMLGLSLFDGQAPGMVVGAVERFTASGTRATLLGSRLDLNGLLLAGASFPVGGAVAWLGSIARRKSSSRSLKTVARIVAALGIAAMCTSALLIAGKIVMATSPNIAGLSQSAIAGAAELLIVVLGGAAAPGILRPSTTAETTLCGAGTGLAVYGASRALTLWLHLGMQGAFDGVALFGILILSAAASMATSGLWSRPSSA